MWCKTLPALLTLALMANSAIAAQVIYSIRYTSDGQRQAYNAYGTIADSRVDYIVNNIGRLSNGRFDASRSGSGVMIYNDRSEGGESTISGILQAMKHYVQN